MERKGFFVVLEGIDGSGKTTVAKAISEFFTEQGTNFLHTREPGGTVAAERLRDLVLWGVSGAEDWCDMTEALLYLASRVQHTEYLIKPALDVGKVVFCERYYDSTYAHQGGGRKIDVPTLKTLHQLTIGDFKPDLIILLDGDPHVLKERMTGRERLDRLESTGIEFQERSRVIHLEQAQKDPSRYLVIDVHQSLETCVTQIKTTLKGVALRYPKSRL